MFQRKLLLDPVLTIQPRLHFQSQKGRNKIHITHIFHFHSPKVLYQIYIQNQNRVSSSLF
jgi:hypothetical protein